MQAVLIYVKAKKSSRFGSLWDDRINTVNSLLGR